METRPGDVFVQNGRLVHEVHVTLIVQDESPSGALVTSRFAGTWRLIDATRGGVPLWLDRGRIEPMP